MLAAGGDLGKLSKQTGCDPTYRARSVTSPEDGAVHWYFLTFIRLLWEAHALLPKVPPPSDATLEAAPKPSEAPELSTVISYVLPGVYGPLPMLCVIRHSLFAAFFTDCAPAPPILYVLPTAHSEIEHPI